MAKKKKRAAQAKNGKISKDADFEKMFGKDIDEFLEDSEWDVDSLDKMSHFSRGSKATIRSAAQDKLRGLEKMYLQRIEGAGGKGAPGGAAGAKKGGAKKPGKFREFQDRFQDDPAYLARGVDDEAQSMGTRDHLKPKKAWDAGSKASSRAGSNVHRVFDANK